MPARARLSLFLIYLAFFASGAACLMAEVTWNRMLIVVVGNSVNATAMILAVFMGGLAIGSQIGGRWFSRRQTSLVPYLLLETAIGIYVISSPVLFDGLSQLFTSWAEGAGDRGQLTTVRWITTLAALLLPAGLMGATFPALVAGSSGLSLPPAASRTGLLYSVNTLGAAVGCFVAGFEFLFGFGVQVTLNCAFGLYLLSALCAGAANSNRKAGTTTAQPRAQAPGLAATLRAQPTLYAATFAMGFVALAYEVLLTRLGILYFGNTLSIFPLVLTGFLVGTALSAGLGTWLYGVICRTPADGARLFAALALAAGALVLASPYLLLTDWVIGSDPYARLADAGSRDPLPILCIIIAPTVAIGALLPVAIRMLSSGVIGEVTHQAATLYALNSAGGLMGSALINHYVVPAVGLRGAFVGLALICAIAAVVNGLATPASRKRWAYAFAATATGALLLNYTLPSIADLHARKIADSTHARSTEVKWVREGRAATVTVLDQFDPERGSHRDLYLNGVEEASTRYWHTQLFKLLGVLPVLMHPLEKPKDVLVIAFGAGITAGSVLASDQVASLDTVDLNPDVQGINDLFAEVNGDVFRNPRFHFHNDDGRNYLVTSGKNYDVIISDSTHPRAYDSWVLYTEEFYRSVQRRLLADGVFAQWVPVAGSMQGDLLRIHLNTFRKVFPHATLWYVYGSDQALLLATPKPFAMDAERLQARLDRLPKWFRAAEYQLDTVARIAGFFWLDPRTMARLIGDERRTNTDRLHYFDKQSALQPLGPQWQLPKFHTKVGPYVSGGNADLQADVRDQQVVAHLMADFTFYSRKRDLFGAYCFMPQNGTALYWMSREFSGHVPEPQSFCATER